MKPILLPLFVFCGLLLLSCKDDPIEDITGLYIPDEIFTVAVHSGIAITDPSRNRTFPILLRHPKEKTGPLPLMIFSHGGGAAANGEEHYPTWGNTLAKAGYLVIHIAHVEDVATAHCAPLGIPEEECEILDFFPEVSEGGTLSVLWYNRPRDATAVLNALDEIESASGVTVDRQRMGIIGHSGGSHTVMSSAGAIVDYSPSVQNTVYSEPRLKVFVANSPQGISRLGWDENSWAQLTSPILIATGTNDITQGEAAPGRLEPFANMSGPDKYQLFINSPDATHDVFGLGGSEPTLDSLEQIVSSTVVAFLDAYLLQNQQAKNWLLQKQIEAASNHVAELQIK
jgi:predicted dienelactone hydrolase